MAIAWAGMPAPEHSGPSPASARRWDRLTRGLLVLGLVLRLYHYLREPAVWHDEAALILNVIGKNFLSFVALDSEDDAAKAVKALRKL